MTDKKTLYGELISCITTKTWSTAFTVTSMYKTEFLLPSSSYTDKYYLFLTKSLPPLYIFPAQAFYCEFTLKQLFLDTLSWKLFDEVWKRLSLHMLWFFLLHSEMVRTCESQVRECCRCPNSWQLMCRFSDSKIPHFCVSMEHGSSGSCPVIKSKYLE